jgi:hypothetical protein
MGFQVGMELVAVEVESTARIVKIYVDDGLCFC